VLHLVVKWRGKAVARLRGGVGGAKCYIMLCKKWRGKLAHVQRSGGKQYACAEEWG